MKKAKHRFIDNCIIEWRKTKDWQGNEEIWFRFKSGETSTMQPERFYEMFAIPAEEGEREMLYNPGHIEVRCPYCNQINYVNHPISQYYDKEKLVCSYHTDNIVMITCDYDEEGCGKPFGITIAAKPEIKIYTVSEVIYNET